MSYTIQDTPPDYSSVQGDLVYTVAYPEHTVDPVTYPNYKFVGDVYVGSTMVARLKRVPDPTTNIGIFNIAQIVRNYIATVFNPTTGAFNAQLIAEGEFFLYVTMKFGEEYSYTTYTNLVTDSERQFFNNYNGRLIGTDSSLAGFNNKFLSTSPAIVPVNCAASNHFIPFLQHSTDGFNVDVKKYVGGIQQGVTLTVAISNVDTNSLFNLNVSASVINAISPGYITCDIDYYTITLRDVDGFQDIKTFKPVCDPVHENYTLHFLNKYGGFESKDFDKVSRKTIQIEKKDFGKLAYTVSPSGVVSYHNSNNVYNESRSVYSSQYKERMVLNSNFLTDEEYVWLQELVLSPLVYLEQEGYYFPAVIVENNYEQRKRINDELTNLTLNIEFGEQLNAQYR